MKEEMPNPGKTQRVDEDDDVNTKEAKTIITLLGIDIEVPEELVEYV